MLASNFLLVYSCYFHHKEIEGKLTCDDSFLTCKVLMLQQVMSIIEV